MVALPSRFLAPPASPFDVRPAAPRAALTLAQKREAVAVVWKPLSALDAGDWAAWGDLASRALQPNVFYEPAFARAAAALPWAHGVGVLQVRAGPRLVGVFPGRVEGLLQGRPVPTFVAWTHPYAPLSIPLVDRAAAETAVAAMLNELPCLPGAPQLALFPLIEEEGSFAQLLADHLYRRVRRPRRLAVHERAALEPGDGDPLAAISAKKRKELGRQRRRLAERGGLVCERITGEGIEAAIAAFLELEASGWKGRSRGAAAADPVTRKFFIEAVAGLGFHGQVRIDLMRLDGRPIAATVVLFSGDRAWFWKTAYAEMFAHYSPGVLNTLLLTEELGRDRRLALIDSCAVAHHPMIDQLWRGRLAVADWLVPLAGSGPLKLGLAAEQSRYAAIWSLKMARDHLRG